MVWRRGRVNAMSVHSHRRSKPLFSATELSFCGGLSERCKVRRRTLIKMLGASAGALVSGPLPGAWARTDMSRGRGAMRIVLDPGHGGHDPGAIGRAGTYEKDVTLAAGREIRDILQDAGHTVLLTREDDRYIQLHERYQVAQHNKADLFISLHADSAPSGHARGMSVYTLSETASDELAAHLAASENKDELLGGIALPDTDPDVTNILLDLVRHESATLASSYAEDIIACAPRAVRLLRPPHRFAGFAVLKAPDVPSVLVEMGFLSDPQEEQLLLRPEYRRLIGDSILNAANRFTKKVSSL